MKEIRKSETFIKWLKKLKDKTAKFLIAARISRLRDGNPGDNRFLGEISEMRIDYGPGYRVYSKVWFNTPSNQRFAFCSG